MIKTRTILYLLVSLVFGSTWDRVMAVEKNLARGHVPIIISRLRPVGELSPTRQLRLAIGLPFRQPEELQQLLARLYDPVSSEFHKFLTTEEFTARFGPTESDYAAVVHFAETNHLQITARHANRLLLDVVGSTRDVDRAFHIQLRTFRHPTENRDFFAPDTEPMVAAELPILDVSGFSDLVPPCSRIVKRATATRQANVVSRSGSAAGGAYIGNDFRAAYVPGTVLTGAGQAIGLVQFDGFYSNDIVAYASQAGQAMVPLQTVLLDGYNGVPTGANDGNGEVSLDIETTMAMAPGLAKVIVYTGGPNGIPNDVLNRMAVDNTAKQLSCSWGWGGGPSATTDQIFQQMAAQGQSFFLASGDSDAYTAGAGSVNGVDNAALANAPSDSPYLTVVGGTTLTTSGPGGVRVSETVWNGGFNNGSYVGSSGGSSSYYALPVWQQGVSMAANGGSTAFRNLPDVALTADNVYVLYGNGSSDVYGGTSCAAPLWAGFMALVNQQAASYGLPPGGFINPALYALGKGKNYAANFNDITTGNNFSPSSPALFQAVPGYDLCTGWGTPVGTGLINSLASQPDQLGISPPAVINSVGPVGGEFSVSTVNFMLTNSGSTALTWAAGNSTPWLDLAPLGGSLASGASGFSVSAMLNAAATNLLPGIYPATLEFTNLATGVVQNRQFNLQVNEPLLINPTNGFTATGMVGGPFNTNVQVFLLTNLGGKMWDWGVINTSMWLNVSPVAGTLAAGEQLPVTFSLSPTASSLAAGTYHAVVLFTNWLTGSVQSRMFTLQASSSLVQNGGFETGDFTGWSRSGISVYTAITTGSSYVHSGNYGLQTGPSGSTSFLSQTLPTVSNQPYWVSFWLVNPKAGTPNKLSVSWNGNAVFNQTNLPALDWTNLHFLVTALSSSTMLQFGFQNNPAYFGLDDISVTPVAVPVIRTFLRTNATLEFTWNTTPGLTYQFQSKTNLAQNDWLDMGEPFTATNATAIILDAFAQPRRFYRVKILP